MNQNFVIDGGFKVHVDDADDVHGMPLHCLFDAYGLCQHIQTTTHEYGHTLDLVVTADSTSVFDLDVHEMHCRLSDHKCIDFRLPYHVTRKSICTLMTWKWSNFNVDDFVDELASSELSTTVSDDINLLV